MIVSFRCRKYLFLIPALFIAVPPAAAQYAGIPGELPPIPDAYALDVEVSQPYATAFDIPGITAEEANRIQKPTGNEIIGRYYGATVALFPDENYELMTYVFMSGEWGITVVECYNIACTTQISPSERYYAVGADGTSVLRGGITVIDLATGEKYRTTPTSIWDCSDWFGDDYLIIESANTDSPSIDMWMSGDVAGIPWINMSYRTEAEGSTHDFVLYHNGISTMILPESEYYNYRHAGTPSMCENGLFFDVKASPNVIPVLAGIESSDDFGNWIDTTGYEAAFPEYDFRVYVDTLTNSVSHIVNVTPGT